MDQGSWYLTLECELWLSQLIGLCDVMYVCLLTFPGFPPRILMTEALRRSTSGS
jgi:hypothetical protein